MASAGSHNHCEISLSGILLQPHCLTENELINLLRSRSVAVEMSGMGKEKLLDLYRRIVLPMPQRENSKSWRGMKKENNEMRQTESNKKDCSFNIGFNGAIEQSVKKNSDNRLKPPPEVQNGCKKIKLNKGSRSSSMDNIVINDRRKSSEKNDTKPTEKTLTVTSLKDSPEKKKVTLKRFYTEQVCSSKSANEPQTDTTAQKDKKKRSKITWP